MLAVLLTTAFPLELSTWQRGEIPVSAFWTPSKSYLLVLLLLRGGISVCSVNVASIQVSWLRFKMAAHPEQRLQPRGGKGERTELHELSERETFQMLIWHFDFFFFLSFEKEQGREHLQTPRAEQCALKNVRKTQLVWETEARLFRFNTAHLTYTQQSVNSENAWNVTSRKVKDHRCESTL